MEVLHHRDRDVKPRPPSARFCSRCGRRAARGGGERVCVGCGLGLVLWCPADSLPGPAPFLVVSHDLVVQGVSAAAEEALGPEEEAVGRSLLDLLESPLGREQLGRAVRRAAVRPGPPVVLPVKARRPPRRLQRARIVTCGPPRAALVTLA